MNNKRILFILAQRSIRLLFVFSLLLTFAYCDRSPIAQNTISIDVENLSTVGYSDLFSKLEVIPLETNDESLIRRVSKLYINEANGDFVIFDGGQQIGLCFDDKGSFKYSSKGMIGNGPGEYTYPDDFVYNPFHSTFEFLNPSGIINIYGDSMKFVREIKIESNRKIKAVHSFFPIDDDIYALYNMRDSPNQIYFYSVKDKRVIKNQPVGSGIPIGFNRIPFYQFQDSCYFSLSSLSNVEYRIDQENLTLSPMLQLDYGDKTFPFDKAEDYQDFDAMKRVVYSGKYVFPTEKFQNDNYYFIYADYNSQVYFTIYDKRTKTIRTCHSFSDKKSIPIAAYLTNEALYYIIPNTERIGYMTDEHLLSEKDRELLSKLNEDDNPIIIKAYLQN